MGYQVIARKYRPQRFEDVVGQDHVTQTLRNAILQNRIAHAYLFVGPRGTGKTTIARIFSKCLNCTDGPKVDFAPDDPLCVEIAEGRSLDVLEIDGASNRGIDEIRELRDTAVYAPVKCRFKIYIIDEVHMLTREAFNALLKTLEEPPAHVKFMFATTEPEKVLPTILSRCQRFDLKRIAVPQIVKQLSFICGNEGVEADALALEAIARGAEGCLRDAESTLDQLISFCGNQLQEADVLSAFGLASRVEIERLAGYILDADMAEALKSLHFLLDNGKDISRLNSDLLGYFRNLILCKISKGDRSLLEVSDAEWNDIVANSERVSLDVLQRIMSVLLGNELKLSRAASRAVVMELSIVEAVQARDAMSIDTLIEKLSALKGGGSSSGNGAEVRTTVPPFVSPSPQTPRTRVAPAASGSGALPPSYAALKRGAAAVSAPTQTPVAPASSVSVPVSATSVASSSAPMAYPADLDAFWKDFLKLVQRKDIFSYNFLKTGSVLSFADKTLTVGIPDYNDGVSLVLGTPEKKNMLEGYLEACGYPECRVLFVASASKPLEAAGSDVSTETANIESSEKAVLEASPATDVAAIDFKSDPLIQTAQSLFQAVIVQTGTK